MLGFPPPTPDRCRLEKNINKDTNLDFNKIFFLKEKSFSQSGTTKRKVLAICSYEIILLRTFKEQKKKKGKTKENTHKAQLLSHKTGTIMQTTKIKTLKTPKRTYSQCQISDIWGRKKFYSTLPGYSSWANNGPKRLTRK